MPGPTPTRPIGEPDSDLGSERAHLADSRAGLARKLTLGFRVPGEVIEYAARLLPFIAPDLAPPTSVRRTRGELAVTRVDDLVAATVDTARIESTKIGSVGLILPDAHVSAVSEALTRAGIGFAVLGEAQGNVDSALDSAHETALDVVPTSLAKGLEFDHVLLLEPAGVVAGEADHVTGLRRLYVCLTRAVTSLVVLHTSDLPGELGEPALLEAGPPEGHIS